MDSEWKAILEGDYADKAAQLARDLIDVVQEAIERVDGAHTASEPHHVAFAHMVAQGALVSAYLPKERGGCADTTTALLDRSQEWVDGSIADAMRFGDGLPGLAWMFAHLNRLGYDVDDGLLENLDAELAQFVSVASDEYPTGLRDGLVGIGVYGLERGSSGTNLVSWVVDRLRVRAEKRPDRTATWFRAPGWLPGPVRDRFPNGCYDLGMGHGVAGVIAFLAHAHLAGAWSRDSKALLAGGVDWLLAQRWVDGDDVSSVPFLVAPGTPRVAAPAQWDYGDLGAAAALWSAGRVLGPDLLGEATRTARRASATLRKCGEDGPVQISEGSAGQAHVIASLAHAGAGDAAELREVAAGLAKITLQRGRAQLDALRNLSAPKAPATPSLFDLFGGLTGVALVLLSASTDMEPLWDRCLLLR